ncbi:MAG: hypothetical protein KAI70_03120, partial [Candidatus Omnitrophica bacterium]|nr:hypothetical protein [Candidatus Omnitrophota bacterium]
MRMFDYICFTWYSATTLLSFLVSCALSVFVYRNTKANSSHRYYVVVLLCMGIWCLASFLISVSPYNEQILRIARFFHLGGIYSSFFFILWIFGIGENRKPRIYKVYILFSGIGALALTFCNFGSNLLLGVVDYNHFFIPFHSAGIYYHFFVGYLFLNGFMGFFDLARKIRKTKKENQRIQLKYILSATIVMYVAGASYYLFVYNFKVWPFADIFVVLSNLVITYAILRHQLMDIEVIIKKTLVFAGLFAVSYGVFAGFAYLGSVLFENVVQNRWIAMIPSVAIVVLLLRPLENLLRNVTDRY